MNSAPADREIGHAIEMFMLCRTFRVLPRAGGLHDQPWIVVEFLKMCATAQNEKEKREAKK